MFSSEPKQCCHNGFGGVDRTCFNTVSENFTGIVQLVYACNYSMCAKNNAKRVPVCNTNRNLDNNMSQQVLSIITEFILNRTIIVI